VRWDAAWRVGAVTGGIALPLRSITKDGGGGCRLLARGTVASVPLHHQKWTRAITWAKLSNFQGRYSFALSEAVARGELRPLRDPDEWDA
jgi:hypothetical protein